MLIVSGAGVKAYEGNDPIRIDSNSDFDANHGVSGGNGSAGYPWVIEDLEIDGTGEGYCIYVGNTTDYFVIRDCYLHNASGYQNNMYYENSGVILYNVENGTVADSKMATNYNGIYLYASNNNIIDNNLVIMNAYQGINLWHSSDNNTIINNEIGWSEWYGIYVVGHENLEDNISCDYNNISHNFAWFNVCGGMYLAIADHNDIFCNDFSYNDDEWAIGYTQEYGNWNTISGNYMTDNDYGLFLASSSENNIICYNQIQSNAEYGIYIDSSGDNLIYHNNIINNTHQAYDGSGNDWDNGYGAFDPDTDGGNYWSDYNGIDIKHGPYQNYRGADGIGDTPYCGIEGNGQDSYPLMDPDWMYGFGQREEPSGFGQREEPS